uniref:Cornifelin-like n=1 Tax=Saccoglossus kowalevskii TaxID=10224 RepID=A0ABM0GIQ1_SACKO|nr:PREDICTED: cornifelin-like [Saccoglossus kowalevskii]
MEKHKENMTPTTEQPRRASQSPIPESPGGSEAELLLKFDGEGTLPRNLTILTKKKNNPTKNGKASCKKHPREWTSDIWHCAGEPRSCMCGSCFFPCFMCELSARLEEPFCAGFWWPCGLTGLRTKMRLQHKIRGDVFNDVLCATCCGPCAACQMARELDYIDVQLTD